MSDVGFLSICTEARARMFMNENNVKTMEDNGWVPSKSPLFFAMINPNPKILQMFLERVEFSPRQKQNAFYKAMEFLMSDFTTFDKAAILLESGVVGLKNVSHSILRSLMRRTSFSTVLFCVESGVFEPKEHYFWNGWSDAFCIREVSVMLQFTDIRFVNVSGDSLEKPVFPVESIDKASAKIVRTLSIDTCIGLQMLRLPALVLCEILLARLRKWPGIKFHYFWQFVTKIKHFV